MDNTVLVGSGLGSVLPFFSHEIIEIVKSERVKSERVKSGRVLSGWFVFFSWGVNYSSVTTKREQAAISVLSTFSAVSPLLTGSRE